MTAAAQFRLMATDAHPENPDNNQYIPVINASTYPSIVAVNKKMPRVSIHTCLKPLNGSSGWSNADFFNSHLNTDTTNNTDYFAYGFADEADTRLYDYLRCERCDLAQNASGGPVAVMLGYKGRWGDSEAPYGTTLADSGEVIPAAPAFTWTSPVPDAGQVTPPSKVSVVGLDKVKGFQLTFLRGQAAQFYFNGDNHPADIISTMFSGVATFDQEPDASTVINDTGTITIKFNTDLTALTGRFKTTLLLKRDNRFKPVVNTLGNVTCTYSMFDQTSGGNPATFLAY